MARKNPSSEATPPVGDLTPEQLDALRREARGAAENLQNRSEDVVGYWNPDVLPIVCIPQTVRLFDSQLDAQKPSVLIQALLVKPTVVTTKESKDSDPKSFLAKKGDLVGIWYKPGMKAISTTAGVETFVEQDGEKDTGKGNPMKTYNVKANGGTLLPIASDSRAKSAHVKTPFDVRRSSSASSPPPQRGPDANDGGSGEDEDIPF